MKPEKNKKIKNKNKQKRRKKKTWMGKRITAGFVQDHHRPSAGEDLEQKKRNEQSVNERKKKKGGEGEARASLREGKEGGRGGKGSRRSKPTERP